MTMRRSFAAFGVGLCGVALTACTPEISSIGTASRGDAREADRTATVASRGAGRTPSVTPGPSAQLATTAVPVPLTASVLPAATVAPSATTSADADVISFGGTHGVRIGQTIAELTGAGLLGAETAGCARHFSTFPYADPVFDHETLAFIWAYPPLHTPEGVMVGTPVSRLRDAYPAAERLIPPTGSPTFDGALVHNPNGVAYLILHDNDSVQKLIVGREDAVRMLYTHRLDTC